MRGIGDIDFETFLDDVSIFTPPTKAKRVVKEPNGPALVRLECADGLLIEGRAVEYRMERDLGGSRQEYDGPMRIVVTFLAEATTPDWKTLHAAGEDMGEPINPDDPELQPKPEPTPPANPKWGQFA